MGPVPVNNPASASRWNPCLPILPPETPDRARIQAALWRHWRKDLDNQLIAAAVTRQPFPLIDVKTGKAVQVEVTEPAEDAA